jgi:hypothetical protein
LFSYNSEIFAFHGQSELTSAKETEIMNEVIMKFKGIFQQCIPGERNMRFGIKIYKHHGRFGYMYIMHVLGKSK